VEKVEMEFAQKEGEKLKKTAFKFYMQNLTMRKEIMPDLKIFICCHDYENF
jgi:hypothetical protein